MAQARVPGMLLPKHDLEKVRFLQMAGLCIQSIGKGIGKV